MAYTRSSDTVDECIEGSLANGFTYYMDERDCEWLEKVNEEARGDGHLVGPGEKCKSERDGTGSGATYRDL